MITAQNLRTMLCNVPSGSWTIRKLEGTLDLVDWLPVFDFCSSHARAHRFGLTSEGLWCAEFEDRARVFPPTVRVPFLPLLTRDWREVATELNGALASNCIPPKAAWTFPLDETVLLGLSSSEYWRRHALAWIEHGYPLTDAIAAILLNHPRVADRYCRHMRELFGAEG
jgi:hypothetical protein